MPGRARLALVTASFLWAGSFIAVKVALDEVPPLVVVTVRLLISSVCFLPWVVTTDGVRDLGGARGLCRVFLLGFVGVSLHFASQTIGLQYTTATNGSIYTTTGPITILLLSAVVLGERISLRKATGVAVAMIGVLIVMGWNTLSSFELGNIKGDLLILTSLVMWALFTVFGKRVIDELGALRVTAWATILGTVSMIPLGWYEARASGFSAAETSLRAWVAIAFLGIACSFLATLLYFVALGLSESQKVGVYLYAIPPMTAVMAALYLGEVITPNLVFGALLVIGGVALTERG
jgi:drug/metabolite transporter (DMT)-like permease